MHALTDGPLVLVLVLPQERQLPLLKEEKPGLKLMQYKDLMWKAWQKSPENPMVQAAAVGR